jgi:hypothetical protein
MVQVMNNCMNKHTQYMDNLFGNDKKFQIQPSYNAFNMGTYLMRCWFLIFREVEVGRLVEISTLAKKPPNR